MFNILAIYSDQIIHTSSLVISYVFKGTKFIYKKHKNCILIANKCISARVNNKICLVLTIFLPRRFSQSKPTAHGKTLNILLANLFKT